MAGGRSQPWPNPEICHFGTPSQIGTRPNPNFRAYSCIRCVHHPDICSLLLLFDISQELSKHHACRFLQKVLSKIILHSIHSCIRFVHVVDFLRILLLFDITQGLSEHYACRFLQKVLSKIILHSPFCIRSVHIV